MIAVKWESYKESGCINCGCEYCYSDGMQGPTTPVICGECKTKFLVMNNDLEVSSIGFPKENYDGIITEIDGEKVLYNGYDLFGLVKEQNTEKLNELKEILKEKAKNGRAIVDGDYVYPLPQEHPRKGIAKHKYVRPDVRPENGIGDFCNPRGVGYDLACFVKSKEAGQRITDMINKVNEEYENKGFSCWLDYRENEPNWIQVKINYPDELRALFLSGLIAENDNIITEDIVKNAITMKIDFASYWKYKASGRVYNAVEMDFMHGIIGKPEEFTKEQRDEIYHETWQKNNYLDQFEVWGAYKQIDLELEKGNVENAVALARHLVDLNGDHFNYELMVQRGKEREYITNLRGYLHEELVKTLNIHYRNTGNFKKQTDGKQTCDYTTLNESFKLSEDMKQQFVSDWQKLIPMIFDVVDLETLKTATIWKYKKDADSIAQEKQALNRYSNLYAMFSLFGLYAQVSRNIEEGQIENAVLAVEHVSSQMQSPLFSQLQAMTSNNDTHFLRTQTVYAEISNTASKYYGEQVVPGTPKKLTR